MVKWFLAFLALIAAIIVALVILTITEVIQPQSTLVAWGRKVPFLAPHIDTYALGRRALIWRENEQGKIEEAWLEVEEEYRLLEARSQALDKRSEELQRIARTLDDRVQKLKEEDGARRNLDRLASIYREMPLQETARILQELDPKTMIDLLAILDSREIADILTLLPTELAASLSEQLKELP